MANYSYYRTITIDHTKVPSSQINFPVLISFTNADLKTVGNGGKVQNANGYDIGFFFDPTLNTPATWEIERYSASSGEVIAWVNIPNLSSTTDTVIYVGYGNSNISTFQSVAQNVWQGFQGVWHLSDGTSLNLNDSAYSANNLTNNSGTATTGQADGGAGFNGSTWADVNSSLSLNISNQITVSAWVKRSRSATREVFLGKGNFIAPSSAQYYMEFQSTDRFGVYLSENSTTDHRIGFTDLTTTDTNFHLYHLTYDGTTQRGYKDATQGTPDVSATWSNVITTTSYKFAIGRPGELGTIYFSGTLDEVRISNVARSADWITTEYNNQNSPSTFFTLGSERTPSVAENWTFYAPLTYDHNLCGSTGSTNFTALVDITDNKLRTVANGGVVTNSSGCDIGFYSGSSLTTLLNWEVEDFDGTTGRLRSWVKIPVLNNHIDDTIYISAGNSLVSSFLGGTPGSAYDSSFKSVWHLPNGTSLSANDSTFNTNNASVITNASATGGKIDGGAYISGSTTNTYIKGSNVFNLGTATQEVWCYITSNPSSDRFVAGFVQGNGGGTHDQNIFINSTGKVIFYVYDGSTKYTSGSTSITLNAWNHIVGVADGTQARCYLNGTQIGSTGAGLGYCGYSGANALLGGHTFIFGSMPSMRVDEYTISSGARSASWVLSRYNNQNSPTTFWSLGQWVPNPYSWSAYVPLTYDKNLCGTTGSTNFTALVDITDNNLKTTANGGLVTNSSGYDIGFFSGSSLTNLLNWEIENYDGSVGRLRSWVKIPTIYNHINDTIYMAVGNSAITSFFGGNTGSAWDSSFVSVFHFNQSPSGPGSIFDSTNNNNKLTPHSGPTVASGKIGDAYYFSGSSYVDSATSTSLGTIATNNKVTQSIWVKNANVNQAQRYVADRLTNSYAIIYGYVANTYELYGNGGGLRQTIKSGVADNNWHKIDIAWDGVGDTVNLYYDGVNTYSGSTTVNIGISSAGIIAGTALSNAGFFDGTLDEWRLSNTARSPSWITTEYNNQNSPTTFWSQGPWIPNSSSWSTWAPLTYDKNLCGTTGSTNFTALVDITADNLKTTSNGGFVTNSSGYDIAFYSGPGLSYLLNWEVETYDGSQGRLRSWVKIPTIYNHVNDTIYIAAGNSIVTSYLGGSTGAAWDANFKGVWHFASGSFPSQIIDSTGKGGSGTNIGSSSIDGKIDGAVQFNSGSKILLSNNNNFNIAPNENFTLGVWFKTSYNYGSIIAMRSSGSTAQDVIDLNIGYEGVSDAPGRLLAIIRDDKGTGVSITSGPLVNNGEWQQGTLIRDINIGLILYLNGSYYSSGSLNAQSGSISNNLVAFGADQNWIQLDSPIASRGKQYFSGSIDEVRFSNVARSPSWITTEYNNQNLPTTFWSLGSWSQNALIPNPIFIITIIVSNG